jgi:hypothetical protein
VYARAGSGTLTAGARTGPQPQSARCVRAALARTPDPRVDAVCGPLRSNGYLSRVEASRFEPGRAGLLDDELLSSEELWTEGGAPNHSGWFCVRTNPFPCPARGCTFIAEFMTAAHLILVWQQRDDPNLLRHAERAKQVGRNPRILEYETTFGPSASYYAWEAAGGPVHGVRAP